MNDTPNLPTKAPLRAGGNALGIIPSTIEDVWRVAGMIVTGKMAPDALTKKRTEDEQRSAVATIIMSGLELGLSPMVAMRSFGMIGNKPGLYGDGLINVCRRSGMAEFIRTGYERNNPRKLITLGKTEEEVAAMKPNELTYGWCWAKRRDTGEEVIEIFTKQDAIDAQLWDDRAVAPKWDYDAKKYVDKPNEAPWFRYKPRMMQWRPAGYGLRNLFADVLGGIPSMDELEEVGAHDMIDVTGETRQIQSRPTPPEPPADDDEATTIEGAALHNSDQQDGGKNEVADDDGEESPTDFLTRLDGELAVAKDNDTLLEIWEREDAATVLDGTPFAEDAEKIYDRHKARVEKLMLEAQGATRVQFRR